jgi:hypothetical protein
MSTTPPEASTEYSTQSGPSKGDFPLGIWLALGALLGAVMLIVAEATALYTERLSGVGAGVSHSTGAHNSYALIPLAVAVVLLAFGVWRGGSRPALLAIGIIGIAALLIALIGDLPDAHASGLVHGPGGRYVLASTTPSAGFYLESGGAVLLIVVSVGGFILAGPPPGSRRRRVTPVTPPAQS